MRSIFFEPVGGASGDMILGALLDLGASPDRIVSILRAAGITGFSLKFARTGPAHGIQYGRCLIETEPQHQHRHLRDLLDIVDKAEVSDRVRHRATAIFTKLAEAEAAVHDMPIDKVHFHEVGAVDTIVDVLGACIALEELEIDHIYCSEMKTGKGTISCSHGTLPVPVPAVSRMLAGHLVQPLDIAAELTTPTGAAILTTLSAGNWRGKSGRFVKSGTGHGQRDLESVPNIIRAMLMDDPEYASQHEEVEVLETDIDDQSPELTAMLCDSLRLAGALDVTLTQVIMKKGRPGVRVTILAAADKTDEIIRLLFTHSSTIGVRQHRCQRHVLKRRSASVHTEYGEVNTKVVERPNGPDAKPEAAACLALARKAGVSPARVMEAANKVVANQSQSIPGEHQ